MTSRLGRTVVLARDLDLSAAFYGQALGFLPLFDEAPGGFRLLHVGPGDLHDPGLWLYPADEGAPVGEQAGGAPFLVVYVDDVHATLERVPAAGGTVSVHATAAPDGSAFAHVHDPDGNEIILVQP